jgi:uncharacterized membrane protein YcaP (DUF421 family)
MAQDEYLSDLRLKGITQMGQVKHAFIEASGEISLVYYSDEDVKYGLPILPGPYDNKQEEIVESAIYWCLYCANTEELKPASVVNYTICSRTLWVKANNERRLIVLN